MAKQGGIPLDWLVNITSAGVRDAFSISKLPTLLVTKVGDNPAEQWNKFYDAQGVKKVFGYDSASGAFADNYFGFTSKKASKADMLSVLVWNESATQAMIKGGIPSDLEALKKLNGGFTFNANGQSKNVSVDLTSANSYTDVATKLQDKIRETREFNKAEVSFNAHTKGFIVKNGTAGADSKIAFISPATEGTDISEQLGLTENGGAVIIPGYNAIANFGELLTLIDETNGAYYVLAFDFDLGDDETLALAKFVDSSNDRYLGIVNTKNANVLIQDSALDAYKGYNGVIFDYAPDNSIAGFSAGIISALDFSQTGGNANIAFNDATKYESVAITKRSELENLNANNANSILKFAQIGQSQTWYGMGNIQGTKTNSANIYICNSYLKFQLQFACANMFNAQGLVGLRGASNETTIMAYLESVFLGAVKAGIIIEGAELTTTEKQSLISSFGGEKGETAQQQCHRQGYYYMIDKTDLVNQTLGIVVAYVANKPANRIIINNYILGA